MTPRRTLVALLVAVPLLACAAPPSALAVTGIAAQPEELWDEFPLDSERSPPPPREDQPSSRDGQASEGEQAQRQAASQTRAAAAEEEPAADESSDARLPLWLVPLLGALAFIGGVFVGKAGLASLERRRRRRERARRKPAHPRPEVAFEGIARRAARSAIAGSTGTAAADESESTSPALDRPPTDVPERPATPPPAAAAREEPESAVEPAEEAVEPAEEAVEPAEEAVEPAEEAVEPAEEAVEPAEEAASEREERVDERPPEPVERAEEPPPDAVERVEEPPRAVEPVEEPPQEPAAEQAPPEAVEPVQEPPEPAGRVEEAQPPAAAPEPVEADGVAAQADGRAAQADQPETEAEPAPREGDEGLTDDVVPLPATPVARPARPGGRFSPSPERAVGYVSAADVDDPAADLEAQTEEIRAACARSGFASVEVVRDFEAHAGPDLERPGLNYAIERLETGEASSLVVTSLERLTSSAAHLGELIDRLLGSGIRLIVLDIQLDTGNPDGRLAAEALANVGTLERRNVGSQTRRSSRAPRAGDRSKRRPALADRPALKERIAEMRARGMTLQAIADMLNAEGIPTLRGGSEWRPSSVQAAVGYKRPKRGSRKAGAGEGNSQSGGERKGEPDGPPRDGDR